MKCDDCPVSSFCPIKDGKLKTIEQADITKLLELDEIVCELLMLTSLVPELMKVHLSIMDRLIDYISEHSQADEALKAVRTLNKISESCRSM